MKVGLLGGSFNPAHDGHVHISLAALRHLGLDAIWWLVSPQNPLKSTDDMAPLEKRLQSARQITEKHPRLVVTDIEMQMGTRYTADTLEKLHHHFPKTKFVWMMGTDNLQQVHHWQKWRSIFETTPIAVIDRPPALGIISGCPAMIRYGKYRRDFFRAQNIADAPTPAWTVLHTPLNNSSATRIRAENRRRNIITRYIRDIF